MKLAPLKLVASSGQSRPTEAAASGRPRLSDILHSHGLLSAADLAEAQALADDSRIPLGEALCANGSLPPEGLVQAMERQWGIRRIDLALTPSDARLVSRLGPVACLHHRTIPWRRIGAATVVVTEDPEGFERVRALYESRLGPLLLAVAAPGEVGAAIARCYPRALAARAETRVPSSISSRRWQAEPFRLICAALGLAALVCAMVDLPSLIAGVLILTVATLVLITGLKLAAIIAQALPEPDRTPIVSLAEARFPKGLPCISVLLPLYKEEHIAGHLIQRMERIDYPRALLDACLVVEADDLVTHATLDRTDLPSWMRVIVVPKGTVKTKPRAMNYALDFCRGSIIGVYDAEDAPAPDQLRLVAARFAEAGPQVACLQGGLDFYNTRHNWMSRCFTLEYASWFQVMLPGIARLGLVVPLGGTTLFFRRDVLEDLGAWDAHNVTEDADLGVRLSRAGYRTEIIDTLTEEEACSRPWSWVKQRSRWLKGYAMTYAVHMRRPMKLWQDLGPKRFLGFQVMFIGTLLQFALAPLLWSMWAVPLGLPHPAAVALPGWALWTMGAAFALSKLVNLAMTSRAMQRTRRLGLLALVLIQPVYFALATLAVYKAFHELFHSPFYWDKTQHGQFGGSHPLHAPSPRPDARPDTPATETTRRA